MDLNRKASHPENPQKVMRKTWTVIFLILLLFMWPLTASLQTTRSDKEVLVKSIRQVFIIPNEYATNLTKKGIV
ncbi:unnamed protein product [Ilex paraguariensis]|uniref:Uncharacterized protein n=1 Tax=Ilex paraguariensis TaxID=185542 RepID=A0ABC8R117_9AQUA